MAISSSSSYCCETPFCVGDACAYFTSWVFIGMNEHNSDNCVLYVRFEEFLEPGSSSSSFISSSSSYENIYQHIVLFVLIQNVLSFDFLIIVDIYCIIA